MISEFDAVIVPGGGLLPDGSLPPWVMNRFDHAMARAGQAPIIPLSAATTHKPLPLDEAGRPLFEATIGGEYLLRHGVPAERILLENASWDTIGNAYFARVIHTDPAGFRKLLIVTSEFHMPRTEAIFRWVFSLSSSEYSLRFEAVPNVGLTAEAVAGRTAREQASLARLAVTRAALPTLPVLHRWLFSAHEAYAAGLTPQRDQDPSVLQSY